MRATIRGPLLTVTLERASAPGVVAFRRHGQRRAVARLTPTSGADSEIVVHAGGFSVSGMTPGDTLVFELEVLQLRRQLCRMAGRGLVGQDVVAEAEFMARIMDR